MKFGYPLKDLAPLWPSSSSFPYIVDMNKRLWYMNIWNVLFCVSAREISITPFIYGHQDRIEGPRKHSKKPQNRFYAFIVCIEFSLLAAIEISEWKMCTIKLISQKNISKPPSTEQKVPADSLYLEGAWNRPNKSPESYGLVVWFKNTSKCFE
jgi:hypothetical protein